MKTIMENSFYGGKSDPVSTNDLSSILLSFPSEFPPTSPPPPQVSMSLSSDQSPTPCSLSSAFPPVSKSTHTGGINVNAAPFQSVQAVRFLSGSYSFI